MKFNRLDEKYRNFVEKMIEQDGICWGISCYYCPHNLGIDCECVKIIEEDPTIGHIDISIEYIRQLNNVIKE